MHLVTWLALPVIPETAFVPKRKTEHNRLAGIEYYLHNPALENSELAHPWFACVNHSLSPHDLLRPAFATVPLGLDRFYQSR